MSRARKPGAAMLLAAGLGTRMRPLTDTTPKPLIEVRGRSLLDHALDRVAAAGISRVVVNVHHLADQIEDHVATRKDLDITVSDEREVLLETGGGIKHALPLIDADPFVAINADSLWIDGATPLLQRMMRSWDARRMDMLLAVHATAAATGYDGRGDFTMETTGRLDRRTERGVGPFVFMGVSLLRPKLFADTPDGAFSLSRLFDRALEAERLHGLRHDGLWMHVGTPEAVADAERAIADSIQ